MNGPLHNLSGADAYNAVQTLDRPVFKRRRHPETDTIVRPAQIHSAIVLLMVITELAVLAVALGIVIHWMVKP